VRPARMRGEKGPPACLALSLLCDTEVQIFIEIGRGNRIDRFGLRLSWGERLYDERDARLAEPLSS
jgi:hypothetical protein